MNIILVPAGHDYSFISTERQRIEFCDEHNDPMQVVEDFGRFFERLDGRETPDRIKIDIETIKKAFWDRDEFLAMLREVCTNDVYMQPSEYYSMVLGFLTEDDRMKVSERLSRPRVGFTTTFPIDIATYIDNWLIIKCGLNRKEYEKIITTANTVSFTVRDEVLAGVMRLNFTHSKPSDFTNQPPPIPDNLVE